jgi:anti-sigma B factor antagonist
MMILPLTVTVTREGQVCVVAIGGELDIASTPVLAEQAEPALRQRAERLILDLSGLEFIDSAGACALAALADAAPPGCPVVVRGAGDRVRRVLDILALPLERCGTETLSRADWLILESTQHGAGHGRLLMWRQGGMLVCQVEDAGPRARPGQGPAAPGGNAAARWPRTHPHGLWLVGVQADQLTITSGSTGTRATAAFTLG